MLASSALWLIMNVCILGSPIPPVLIFPLVTSPHLISSCSSSQTWSCPLHSWTQNRSSGWSCSCNQRFYLSFFYSQLILCFNVSALLISQALSGDSSNDDVSSSYGAPSAGYGPPSYKPPPVVSYDAPSYEAPSDSYGVPSYEAPSSS